LITEEYFIKHTSITTIYNDKLKEKLITKVIKMPSWKNEVQRTSGLIKRGRKCKRFKGR
jgi:hypothetical protein